MNLKTFYKLKNGQEGQLICFPYLGGYSSSFQSLIRVINDDIEIWVANPPGHFGSELKLVNHIDKLISIYEEDIDKIVKPGSVFFGHSMGGIVAYSLLESMVRHHISIPKTLIMSASAAPSCFKNRNDSKLNEKCLISKLITYGGMPIEVLNNHELMESMLPIFQADFAVLESCGSKMYEKIDVNTYLLWGMNDKTESFDLIRLWQKYLSSKLNVIPVYGGEHMFVHDKAEEVATYIHQIMNLPLENVHTNDQKLTDVVQ